MPFKYLRIPKRTIQEPKLPKGLWRNSDLGDILNLCEKTKLPPSLNTNYYHSKHSLSLQSLSSIVLTGPHLPQSSIFAICPSPTTIPSSFHRHPLPHSLFHIIIITLLSFLSPYALSHDSPPLSATLHFLFLFISLQRQQPLMMEEANPCLTLKWP